MDAYGVGFILRTGRLRLKLLSLAISIFPFHSYLDIYSEEFLDFSLCYIEKL